MLRRILLILLALAALAASAHADYLEIRRRATLKDAPNRNGSRIRYVEDDETLVLLQPTQSSGYYKVFDPVTGREGWIYRTYGRRFRGDPPAPDIIAGLTLIAETPPPDAARSRHLRLGRPRFLEERVRTGFALAHDSRLKIPAWVQYELRAADLLGGEGRTDDFRADTSIPFSFRAETGDYEDSGFDQGHMAPAQDMAWSDRTMSDSFLLSNMAPQVGEGFNRAAWLKLESAVRGWAEQRTAVTVITGPVFEVVDGGVFYEVIGANRVAVPTAFFKIVVADSGPGDPQALAFILPNEDLRDPPRDYHDFLRSIDEVERATGIDFLAALPDDVEERVEARVPQQVW